MVSTAVRRTGTPQIDRQLSPSVKHSSLLKRLCLPAEPLGIGTGRLLPCPSTPGGIVEELFFDATKVEANAAVDSLAPSWFLEGHLQALFEEDVVEQEEGALGTRETEDAQPEENVRGLPAAGDEDLIRANSERNIGSPGTAPRTTPSNGHSCANGLRTLGPRGPLPMLPP